MGRFAPVLLVALLLIFLQWRSGTDTSYIVVVAAMAVFAYLVIAAGRLVLAAAGLEEFDPNGAYVLGLLAICLSVYAVTALLSVTAAVAFGVVAAIVIGLEIAFSRRIRLSPPDWRALTGFALCVGFTAAWCYGPAHAYEVVRTQGILPVWTDYFIHGSLISQFGDIRAVGHQSIFLADFPSSFYHFGSYAAAAALAGILDQPGLPLAVSAWLPLGFLAMAAGAFALGERLAGPAGGLAALGVIAILPDASNYGLRNGIMSFHWSILAHPGATYALGAAFLSLTFLDRWVDRRQRTALVASTVLAVSAFFMRAHIFLLYFPAWIATAVYCLAQETNRRRVALLLVATLGVAAVAASLILAHVPFREPAAQWRFGEPALPKFLRDVHMSQEPTAYTGVYAELLRERTPEIAFTAGILLALLAALGAFCVLLPAAAALAARRRGLEAMDVFPAFVAFCWLLLLLFAPVTWADESTDLVERPIVFLYATAGIWTACLLLRSVLTGSDDRAWRVLLAGALAALPAIIIGAQSMARPKFEWGERHVSYRLEPGLAEAGAFLRSRGTAGDLFAAGGLGTAFVPFDLPVIVCSLSGMPTYLSRPHIEMAKEGLRKTMVAERLAALQRVEAQHDYGDAMQLLKQMRVQWFLTAGERGPPWDPQSVRAAFRAGRIAVHAVK